MYRGKRVVGGNNMLEWMKSNWSGIMPIIISVASLFYTAIVWKKQKKLDDGLARSKAAYDIILKKEFDYYENADSIYAKLIPGIQDISAALVNGYPKEYSKESRERITQEEILIYLKSIKELKNLLLMHDIYIPDEVSKASRNVIQLMQSEADFISEELEKLWNGRENEMRKEECQRVSESILFSYATVRFLIKKRLETLAKLV